MPRINIEDTLFKDSRFIDLLIKIGDQDKALGIIVRAFMTAQSHFLSTDNDRLIPLEDWRRQRCSDILIEVGLAIKKSGGIYVCGSEKQFSWLLQRQAAGKATKSRKKSKKKRSTTDVNGTKRNETGESGSERVETSNSFSFSSSNSFSDSDSDSSSKNKSTFTKVKGAAKSERNTAKVKVKKPGTDNSNAIAYFCDLWKSKYGVKTSPSITKKEAGIVKRIAESMGLEKTKEFMEAYFAMPDSWVIKQAHPITLLDTKKMEVHRFMQSGKFISGRDVRTIERKVANKTLFDKFEGGANGN